MCIIYRLGYYNMHTVKNGSLLQHNNVSLLGHVSSILLSKLSNCPNTNTSLCYCNYPFLTVHIIMTTCPDAFSFRSVQGLVLVTVLSQPQMASSPSTLSSQVLGNSEGVSLSDQITQYRNQWYTVTYIAAPTVLQSPTHTNFQPFDRRRHNILHSVKLTF